MTQVTNTLQSLIMGDRSTFIINHVPNTQGVKRPTNEYVAKLLFKMQSKGYTVTNPEVLFTAGKAELTKFKEDFTALVQASTKEGSIIRTTFFNEEYPTAYTENEWEAIIASYAVRYNWTNEYTNVTGNNAALVLEEYNKHFNTAKMDLTNNAETVKFTISSVHDLVDIIRSMVQSKSVLRTHQLEIIKECPKMLLTHAVKGQKISIKETVVLVMKLLKDQGISFPILHTAQDVLRYIVSVHAENPLEGQIDSSMLKDCKIHIPTSDRKMLLNNLEVMNEGEEGAKYLCEDMFKHEAYWKIINKYLQFEQYDKFRIKYPVYARAIDLLYENDRSWTFNGRYSSAKENLDYAKAINIAAERPGFMLRNMMEFMRMATGVSMPKKKVTQSRFAPKDAKTVPNQMAAPKQTTVQTDALSFFQSPAFEVICMQRLNTKLAFQLIEQIEEPRNNMEKYSRIVQDVKIEYETPIPAVDKDMKSTVLNVLEKAIESKLQKHTSTLGKIYVDENIKNYALQYSGHGSTEISLSGEYMAKNTIIPFSELGKQNTIVRLGVLWRSTAEISQSIDIDHSVTLIGGPRSNISVYYSLPEYVTASNKLAAVSSGDVLTCGNHNNKFSVELVDLDIQKLKDDGVTDFYNSFIDFGGRTSIGALECYSFIQVLETKNITLKRDTKNITVDLAKTDYAIRIDPNNTDNTGSYIGAHFDLTNDSIEILGMPIKSPSGAYTNIKTMGPKFMETIDNRVTSLTLGYALEKAFTDTQQVASIEEADLVISRKSKEELQLHNSVLLLHPGKDSEKINEFIFR